MTESDTPAETPAASDIGAETASRYAYQWTHAATLACGVLDPSSGIIEVFCEHHDDILVRYADGTYAAWQIKTRDAGSNPWISTDDSIIAALVNFVQLEAKFPNQFRAFVIGTSHTFLTHKTTSTCLPYVLKLALATADADLAERPLAKVLNDLSSRTGHSKSVVLSVLTKCTCNDGLPKRDNVKGSLVNAIVSAYPKAGDAMYSATRVAADSLIEECRKAASLDHAQTLPAYLSAALDSVDVATQAAVNGKRLGKDRVQKTLDGSLSAPSLLAGRVDADSLSKLSSPERLIAKLEAGGFSQTSITSAQSLRDKADFHSLEWIHRLGDTEGLRRHDHVREVVLHDCGQAEDAVMHQGAPYGLAMRRALQETFAKRRREPGATLFDCLDEHLEGYAFGLTGECKVTWSPIGKRGGAE